MLFITEPESFSYSLVDHSLSAVLRCSIAWNNDSDATAKRSRVRPHPLHSWYTRVLSPLVGGRGGERRRPTEHTHTQGQGMHSKCVQVCEWYRAMCVYMVSDVTMMCVYGKSGIACCVHMVWCVFVKWTHTWLFVFIEGSVQFTLRFWTLTSLVWVILPSLCLLQLLPKFWGKTGAHYPRGITLPPSSHTGPTAQKGETGTTVPLKCADLSC